MVNIISISDWESYIEIQRNGHCERLILEGLMKRSACVAGRATTCWKARHEGNKTNSPFVIKDSWQSTEKEVVNVARYYYYETVRVNGEIDNIRNNVRKGLDYKLPSATSSTAGVERTGRSISITSQKSVYDTNIQDRVYRQVIIKDYGIPIYRVSLRVSLLRALKNFYQSLYTKAGLLQGDVSTGNLILNEDNHRERLSGARGKTGTKSFIVIGLCLGEQYSFSLDQEAGPTDFDCWNYKDNKKLARSKQGIAADEEDFVKITSIWRKNDYTHLYSQMKKIL
ncbi:hypothetical protein BDV41DRAFT_566148 [Aspergillus transmontanensis]|uniref:Fungal-type protein kinase domain-containing protein n=1 Tax=Aspergillus transmontanensis TaxID=1034304 RepID=A0A5N6VVC3_9EURO|nr:hypothetical protein BDV41DRAFT_566148 [Aspergillus transmontanensis]